MADPGRVQSSDVPASGWPVDGLRAAIRSAGRGYRRVAVWCLAVVVLIPVLIVLVIPTVAADAVGLTERVPAVVQVVDRQRMRDNADRRPRWSVTVSWTDADGARHQGSDIVTSSVAPFQVGQRIEVGVYRDDVTLKPPGQSWWILTLWGAVAVIGLVLAGVFWRRSRAWSAVPGQVGLVAPQVLTVTGSADRWRRRSSLLVPGRRGWLVPVRTPAGAGVDSTIFLLDAPTDGGAVRPPAPGDQLDAWRDGPLAAVRRRADGAWWVTSADGEGRDVNASAGPGGPGPSRVGGFVLVLVGAIVLSGGRLVLRLGAVVPGWGLSVLGLAGVIAGIVVLGRGIARARRRSAVDPAGHPEQEREPR